MPEAATPGRVPDIAGPLLLATARTAIRRTLGLPMEPPEERPPWALEPGASFVTLTEHGLLRGCIGSLVAFRPLLDDVDDNAVSAATRDPRFPPLGRDEFEHIAIEVSVLSPPVPLAASSLADAYAAVRPGVDGVIVEFGPRNRTTFLPQVWAELPEPEEFLRHLWLKAGMAPKAWPEGTALQTYTVTAWHEDT